MEKLIIGRRALEPKFSLLSVQQNLVVCRSMISNWIPGGPQLCTVLLQP